MTKDEMQQIRDTLSAMTEASLHHPTRWKGIDAIDILDAELAKPEQEPVAWVEVTHSTQEQYKFHGIKYLPVGKHRLYTSPVAAPQRVWQSLTEVEICDCIYKAGKSFAAHQKGIKGQQLTFADSPDAHLAWALERVLKEKNHG